MIRPTPGADCKSVYIVRARFADTDLMGIVHHAKYLEYFEAGRVEYIHRRGVEYLEWVKRGIHLPVVEVNLRYRKSVRFDERIAVETTVTELGRATVRFTFRILRDTPGAEVVAEGMTLLACVGDDLVPKRIPEDVASLLCSAETHPRPPDHV
ncbi:MAG TPA: acyl-CoA thioesterase [Polyangiaceae bacterium]|nr:acyl-CoA thioesterase [Polyangiaceae bacterium]